MTRLANRKTRLTFETEETARYRGKERPIIVEADPAGFGFSVRLKGTRVRYEMSWRGVFEYAAEVFARNEAKRKCEQRKTKSLARRAA